MRHFIASITSSSCFCEKKSWKSSWGQFEEKLDLGTEAQESQFVFDSAMHSEWTLEVACSGGGTVIERTSASEKKL